MITIETTKETDGRWIAELTEGSLYIALCGKTKEQAIRHVMKDYYEELHDRARDKAGIISAVDL